MIKINNKSKILVEIKNLNLKIKSKRILKNISFSILKNETVAIVGESGSGKTLTALSLIGLIPNNSLISNNVCIQDGCKIGVKGFGFIPLKSKNIRTPHVGKVILEEGVEVGANSTIDRGSFSITVIGENTFLDNQVHVAHNVQIGERVIMAGQCGVSGSVTIGADVQIGGQVGIAPHLKIGDRAILTARSGVTKDVVADCQVAGFPAINAGQFWRERVALRRLAKPSSDEC